MTGAAPAIILDIMKRRHTCTLSDGSTATRESETMTYTHAVCSNGAHYVRVGRGSALREGWHVAHWCGRLDLAQKQARGIKDAVIVEVQS